MHQQSKVDIIVTVITREKSIIEFLGTILPYSQVPSRFRNALTNRSVKVN